jgi:hypothetical protein
MLLLLISWMSSESFPHRHCWLMGTFRVRGVTASRIPHTSSRPSYPFGEIPGGDAGWVTIPFSAIQFSGSAVSERFRSRGPSVGGAGFLVLPGDRVKRKLVPLSRGTAQPFGLTLGWNGGRHPGSETTAPFVAVGLRRPLLPTLCRRLLRPLARPCPSTGCGCYGSLGRKQEVLVRKFENVSGA